MGADRQELIRQRAYEMWEKEGKPYGEDLKHWLRASEEMGEGDIDGMSFSEIGSNDAVKAKSRRTAANTNAAKPKKIAGGAAPAKAKAMPKVNSAAEKTKPQRTVKTTTGEESPKKQVKRVEGP
jgi:hypothetical protein